MVLTRSHLTMLNLTGGLDARNTRFFLVWNDNEFPFSTTREMGCWFDEELSDVSPVFTHDFLITTPNDPTELDLNCNNVGSLETGWARIDSIEVVSGTGQFVTEDGLLLGASTAGVTTAIDGGRLLWGEGRQLNGAVLEF